MPRQASFTTDTLTAKALRHFWLHGYHATSMDDLVAATAVSRHGIYSTFGGKKKLFLACFDRYQEAVVSPAFGPVEHPDADLAAIAAYFEIQISRGEAAGLPGPGCFVANSATEVAPHDGDTMAKVVEHNDRLRRGFRNALLQTAERRGSTGNLGVSELADVCVIFTNGLWSMSRCVTDAGDLRRAVEVFLSALEGAVT